MRERGLERPLWLASRSPRRRQLLVEAGVDACVRPADLDDADLRPGAVSPEAWVMALAYLKARRVADALRAAAPSGRGTVLGADTVCVHEGVILGQPTSAEAAGAMLRRLRAATHWTITGVCLLELAEGRRHLLVDRACVRWGAVTDEAIDAYVRDGAWRGKAGGYNLAERLDAGWSITCEGDPATVMGLPVRRLAPWLGSFRAERGA